MSFLSGLVQGISDQLGDTAEEGLKVMFILVGIGVAAVGLGLGACLMSLALWIGG